MIPRIILFLIIGIDISILFYETSTLSISHYEASLLYGEFSFIQLLENISFFLFGQNDLSLRMPMIILHVVSIILLYKISKKYLIDYRNRLWLISIFILLPGVVSSALLVDSAGLVIFGLLLFIYIYENYNLKYIYFLLPLLAVLDNGFLYLFISLMIFSFYTKNRDLFLYNIFLFLVSLFIYGIDLGSGSPRGHLLDTIGIYSAIFTPIIFVYIFYILYKRFLSKDINIIWFIATIPLLLTLLLSFRQKIYLEEFAPYLIMALPLTAQSFYSSYRVRLKQFRRNYKIIFILSALFLVVNFVVVLFNRELYLIIENPKKHFASKMHIAKELSIELKKRGIYCVTAEPKMQKRLKFYGIDECENIILKQQSLSKNNDENAVTISYRYRPIYTAIVTNINNQ